MTFKQVSLEPLLACVAILTEVFFCKPFGLHVIETFELDKELLTSFISYVFALTFSF